MIYSINNGVLGFWGFGVLGSESATRVPRFFKQIESLWPVDQILVAVQFPNVFLVTDAKLAISAAAKRDIQVGIELGRPTSAGFRILAPRDRIGAAKSSPKKEKCPVQTRSAAAAASPSRSANMVRNSPAASLSRSAAIKNGGS